MRISSLVRWCVSCLTLTWCRGDRPSSRPVTLLGPLLLGTCLYKRFLSDPLQTSGTFFPGGSYLLTRYRTFLPSSLIPLLTSTPLCPTTSVTYTLPRVGQDGRSGRFVPRKTGRSKTHSFSSRPFVKVGTPHSLLPS